MQSEKAEEGVKDYQEKLQKEANSFFYSLESKRCQLLDISGRMTKMLESATVMEQIEWKQDLTAEFNSKIDAKIYPFKLTTQPILLLSGNYCCLQPKLV